MPKAKRSDYMRRSGHDQRSGNYVSAPETDFDEEMEENTFPDSLSDGVDQVEVERLSI